MFWHTHANGGELHLHAAAAVVAVAQEQILLGNVVADDLNRVRQFGQYPHALTLAQRARRVVDGRALAYDGIGPREGVPVLERRVILAHEAQHARLRADQRVGAHDGVAVSHGTRHARLHKAERLFRNFPTKMRGLDGLGGGCWLVEFLAQTVPRLLAVIHHGGLAPDGCNVAWHGLRIEPAPCELV